jgi:hypothetical protein
VKITIWRSGSFLDISDTWAFSHLRSEEWAVMWSATVQFSICLKSIRRLPTSLAWSWAMLEKRVQPKTVIVS